MSWERGYRSTDEELARVQSWIEWTDIELHGPDGDSGVIQQHKDDRVAKRTADELLADQLTKHNAKSNRLLVILSIFVAALGVAVSILAYIDGKSAIQRGIIHWPTIFHHQASEKIYTASNQQTTTNSW